MAIKEFFAGLVGPAVEAYKVHREAKNRLELAKLESEIKAEQAWQDWRVKNIDSDAAWEQSSIQNSGWKDEFVLVVLSIPLLLVFVPWTSPYVLAGFGVLDQTPEWYRWLLAMIYAATFGIRVWRRKVEA
jgi:hypothetical protein